MHLTRQYQGNLKCATSWRATSIFILPVENTDNEYDWSITGGNLVTGQGTHQVLVSWTAVSSGSISVNETSPSGCSTGSEIFEVTIFDCTGIAENEQNRVFIYPNPVRDEMAVKCSLGEAGIARLKIYNFFGQEVIRKEINSDNGEVLITLSTGSLTAGAYSVKLISQGESFLKGSFSLRNDRNSVWDP